MKDPSIVLVVGQQLFAEGRFFPFVFGMLNVSTPSGYTRNNVTGPKLPRLQTVVAVTFGCSRNSLGHRHDVTQQAQAVPYRTVASWPEPPWFRCRCGTFPACTGRDDITHRETGGVSDCWREISSRSCNSSPIAMWKRRQKPVL